MKKTNIYVKTNRIAELITLIKCFYKEHNEILFSEI